MYDIMLRSGSRTSHKKAECSILTSAHRRPGSISMPQGCFMRMELSVRTFYFTEVDDY